MSMKVATRLRRAKIGPRSAGMLMSAEEFDDLREGEWVEGFRYELINGVLVVSPAARPAERGPNELLGIMLFLHKRDHPEGPRLDDTLPEHTVLDTPNRRRCDRAIWAGLGRVPSEERDVPTIVVEFVSSGKRGWIRDYEEKRREYGAAGAKEYWIFDRFARRLTAVRYGEGEPVEIVVPDGGRYETPILPGFVLRVADIFARADAWPDRRRNRKKPGGRG